MADADGRKLVVVDDDPIVLESMKEQLGAAGYQVVVRDQALGTTEFIAANQPDVVLLDVMMPGLSGDRLADVLRRHPQTANVKIILVSSKSVADLETLVARTGADGAIQKTSDPAAFLQRLEELIG